MKRALLTVSKNSDTVSSRCDIKINKTAPKGEKRVDGRYRVEAFSFGDRVECGVEQVVREEKGAGVVFELILRSWNVRQRAVDNSEHLQRCVNKRTSKHNIKQQE